MPDWYGWPCFRPLALWRGVMAARESAYRRGWLQVHDLPLPSVAIGNLTVGGSGKTPIAIWTARYYVSRGLVPGILLRGYGNDEVLVHQHAVPEAQVVADPDRAARCGACPRPGSSGAGAGRCVSAAGRASGPEHRGSERRDYPRRPLAIACGALARRSRAPWSGPMRWS